MARTRQRRGREQGRVPAVGEQFDVDGLNVEVLDAERRRITKVRITRREPAAEETTPA